MATTEQLQQDIQQGIRELPREALSEVKLFIDFIHMREAKAKTFRICDIERELRSMDHSEADHLEQEFSSYQKIYPRAG